MDEEERWVRGKLGERRWERGKVDEEMENEKRMSG